MQLGFRGSGLIRDDFSELKLPRFVVEAIPPDPVALFNFLRQEVTDDMLYFIAEADYKTDVREYLAGLRKIKVGTDLGHDLVRYAHKVMSLIGKSKLLDLPNNLQLMPQYRMKDNLFSHTARAFCIGSLIHLGKCHHDDYEYIFHLTDSCEMLGEPYCTMLLQLMVAELEKLEPWNEVYLSWASCLVYLLTKDERLLSTTAQSGLKNWLEATKTETFPWFTQYGEPQLYSCSN